MGLCRKCADGSLGACASAKGCQPQRENLIEEATLAAEWFGHALSGLTELNGAPIWQAECKLCGGMVSVSLDPLHAEDNVSGEAISTFCEENDEAGQVLEKNRAVP